MVPMGDMKLRTWKFVHGFREPVVGAFRLTDIRFGSVRSDHMVLIGVLSAPGLAPRPMSCNVSFPSGRHIAEGMDLPVMVDLARPDKVRFLWKQVPTRQQYLAEQEARSMQQAAQTAARMAEQMRFGIQNPFGTGPADADPFSSGFGGSTGFSAGPGLSGDLASAVTAAISQAFGGHAQGAWTDSNVHVEIVNGMPGGPIVNGRPGTAVVRAADEVALPPMMAGMVPGGLVDLTLDVTSQESFEPYTVRTRLAFSTPQRRARVSTPGTRLPVLIDPAAPTRVVIDTATFLRDSPDL